MAREPEMHDLAREHEPDGPGGPAVASPMDSKYHYGMRINAGHEELEKMGIHDSVTPGEAYHIHGRAHVVDSAENPETGERSATFHFTHMADAKKIPEGEKGKGVRDEIKDAMASRDLRAEGREKSAANEGKDDEGEKY